jgi:hypothetical protein
LESRSKGWWSHCTYSTRSKCISKGASIECIFRINTIGIVPHGWALTGKERSQDICHLDLWSKSRPQRASVDHSTLVGKIKDISWCCWISQVSKMSQTKWNSWDHPKVLTCGCSQEMIW